MAQDLDLSGESPENEFDYMADSTFSGEEGREGGALSMNRLRFKLAYGVVSTSGGNRTNGRTSYFGTEFNDTYNISIQYFFNPQHSIIADYQKDTIDYFLNTTSFIETEEFQKTQVSLAYSAMLFRLELKAGFAQSEEWAFFNVKNIIADSEKLQMTSFFAGVGSYFPVFMGIVSKFSFQYHTLSYESASFEGTSGVKKVFELDFHYRGFNAVGVRVLEEIITYDTDEAQRVFAFKVLPYVQF